MANAHFGVFFALYLASQVHRAAVKSVFGEYFSAASYEFTRSGGLLATRASRVRRSSSTRTFLHRIGAGVCKIAT